MAGKADDSCQKQSFCFCLVLPYLLLCYYYVICYFFVTQQGFALKDLAPFFMEPGFDPKKAISGLPISKACHADALSILQRRFEDQKQIDVWLVVGNLKSVYFQPFPGHRRVSTPRKTVLGSIANRSTNKDIPVRNLRGIAKAVPYQRPSTAGTGVHLPSSYNSLL